MDSTKNSKMVSANILCYLFVALFGSMFVVNEGNSPKCIWTIQNVVIAPLSLIWLFEFVLVLFCIQLWFRSGALLYLFHLILNRLFSRWLSFILFIKLHYHLFRFFITLKFLIYTRRRRSITVNLKLDILTGGYWQKWKEYSWHVPAMKFIGMKQLV